MSFRTKFNLLLVFTFVIGFAISLYLAYAILQRNARAEVLNNAGLIMTSATAIRNYTEQQIKPLLTLQMKRDFLPQSVPAYAAMQNIDGLRTNYPAYAYKEATLNPTNPINRVTDWEAGIVEWFRNHPEKTELINEREDTPTGHMLYLSRPIKVNSESCLNCHGNPNDAPETMINHYGTANGFGWKLHDVVGAQVVSIPMDVPLKRTQTALLTFTSSLLGVFVLVSVLLNIFIRKI